MNMKLHPYIIVAFLAATLVEIRAQVGTVNFSNGAAQVNAPVALNGSGLGVEGPGWKAELLLQSSSNLVSIAASAPFENGSLAGYFFGGSISVPETVPGQSATFILRVTNIASHFSAESKLVTVTLGGGIMPPANLAGLSALQVPSPVKLSINQSGAQIVLSWPKEASNMLLQSSTEFSPAWQGITVVPSTNATTISIILELGAPPRFFRLSSF